MPNEIVPRDDDALEQGPEAIIPADDETVKCRRRPMLAGNRRANLSITPSEDGEEATGSNGEKSGAKASLPAKPHEALMSLPSVALSSSWVKAQYQVSPSITCCTILSSIIVLRFW